MNTEYLTPIKAGELLILSDGCYSDYGPIGLFRVLKDLNPKEALAAFQGDKKSWTAPSEFTAWLVSQGFIEDVKCREWNIGAYNVGDYYSRVTPLERTLPG